MSKLGIALHPQLQQDCIILGHFELCCLLLLNDANYPWFILVPQRENMREIHDLTADEQHMLIQESSLLSQHIARFFKADKINVAALGNMVPQLHMHHIVRFKDDKAWPKPVWGLFPAVPYSRQAIRRIQQDMQQALPQLQRYEG